MTTENFFFFFGEGNYPNHLLKQRRKEMIKNKMLKCNPDWNKKCILLPLRFLFFL